MASADMRCLFFSGEEEPILAHGPLVSLCTDTMKWSLLFLHILFYIVFSMDFIFILFFSHYVNMPVYF